MVETSSLSVPQLKLNIVTERIDDIPLLVAQMERIGLPGLLDKSFPTHANWQGLSLGWVTSFWCAHILSQADHCLNHVQPWAEKRLQLLHECCTHPVVALDFTDDRLALVLNQLSDDSKWYAFEGSLAQRVMRVYNMNPDGIRLDSSTSYGYWGVTPEGLFQFGHSKDHRPDLPQLKIMLSTLDPSGFPLVTTVVSGEKADDPLYIPAVERVREGLQQRGLLYMGDAKMAAIGTRAFIAGGEDFYLCPLPKKQVSNEQLDSYLEPVWADLQALTKVYATDEDGKVLLDDDENPIQIAEGFERSEDLSATYAGEKIDWSERRLVVRSLAQAHNAQKRLQKQLDKGLAAILGLNERKRGKKRDRDAKSLQEKVEQLLDEYGISGLLQLSYQETRVERKIRGYGERAPRKEIETNAEVEACVNQVALDAAVRRLGWRVYGTNAPSESLTFPVAIRKYRANYSIEGSFKRMKGKPLSIQPLYLQRENHVIGLVRLLSICLRVLVLLEFVARQALKTTGEPLRDVYPGNPKRGTMRPSAELLLSTFKEVTLTLVEGRGSQEHHITPLSPPQQRILELLDMPPTLYENLSCGSCRSSPHGEMELR